MKLRRLFVRRDHQPDPRRARSRRRRCKARQLGRDILGRLDDGEIDAALLYLPERYNGALNCDPLLTEDVHLITPPGYPLPPGPVAAHALDGVPLVLPSTHHGLRLMTESLAARCGFSISIAVECDGSPSLMKRLVIATGACTVLPAAAVTEELVGENTWPEAKLHSPTKVPAQAFTCSPLRNRQIPSGFCCRSAGGSRMSGMF